MEGDKSRKASHEKEYHPKGQGWHQKESQRTEKEEQENEELGGTTEKRLKRPPAINTASVV